MIITANDKNFHHNKKLLLRKFGVPAIWNFTNVDLTQKDMNCVVQNVDIRTSLFTLTYYLENRV